MDKFGNRGREIERIEVLEERVQVLGDVLGQVLYQVTIRGMVPDKVNEELVEKLNTVLASDTNRESGLREGVTHRGFTFFEFVDGHGVRCILQASSAAEEESIWLGPSHPDITMYTHDHGTYEVLTEDELKQRLGVFDIMQASRMHLTREMVADLLPLLKRFVEIGELPGEEVSDG